MYNWTCYKIHRDPVNWFTAVNRCLANNGSLAVFDDQILSYFASTLLKDVKALWIGLIKSWWTWPDAGMSYWPDDGTGKPYCSIITAKTGISEEQSQHFSFTS